MTARAAVGSPKSSPSHGPAKPDPSTFELLDNYRRKYLGIDMILKTLCYALRMRLHFTPEGDAAQRDYLATLIDRIIECRMLCNATKEPGTAKAALTALGGAHGAHRTTFQKCVAILTALSFGFRVIEQSFGDLGLTQKVVMQHWDRYYLSNKYKMFKTFSLICCALLEINKLRSPIRKAIARWAKARAAASFQARNQAALAKGHIRRLSSCNEMSKDGNPDSSGNDGMQETASVITSPVPGTPTVCSPVTTGGATSSTWRRFSLADNVAAAIAADNSGAMQQEASFASSTAEPPRRPQEPLDLISITRKPSVRSALFLTRNIADLIVYSQWIDAWRPWKPLEFACGMVSGGLGVVIVWADTVADATGRSSNLAAP
jgi:hypothetical protein